MVYRKTMPYTFCTHSYGLSKYSLKNKSEKVVVRNKALNTDIYT